MTIVPWQYTQGKLTPVYTYVLRPHIQKYSKHILFNTSASLTYIYIYIYISLHIHSNLQLQTKNAPAGVEGFQTGAAEVEVRSEALTIGSSKPKHLNKTYYILKY